MIFKVMKSKHAKAVTLMVVALAVAPMVRSTLAETYAQNQSPCVISKLDDKGPFPFKNANTKFELAEGETYVLTGYVVEKNGRPYFGIDFNAQPWLATKYRTQRPYLLLDPGTSALKTTGKELVQVAVIAGKLEPTAVVEVLKLIIPPVTFRHHR